MWHTNRICRQRATTTIPILIAEGGDIMNTGLVLNLAHQDANLTGFIALNVDPGKQTAWNCSKRPSPACRALSCSQNPANPLNRVNLDLVTPSQAKSWA